MIKNGLEPVRIHLVVVEFHYHSDLLKNLYDVLSLGGFRITLVTLPHIYEGSGLQNEADDAVLEAHLKSDEERLSDFVDRMKPVFQSADMVYFNTIRHYWQELNRFPLEEGPVTIVRIHNAHCDLAPLTHFYRPLINLFAIASHLIRKVLIGGEWRLKKRFFSRIDYFMFPNEAVTDYVRRHGWVRPDRILDPIMPFGYLGKQAFKVPKGGGDDGYVTIAVTGKVTNDKKDFKLLAEALRRCLGDLARPVRLILLGKAAGKEGLSIVEDFKALESSRFVLDYSNHYIAPDAFYEKAASVDFLVAPICVDTHFRKYHEVYGKSKMSGIENDLLMFRKPSLITAKYPIKGELEKVVDYFDDNAESLAAQLRSWVNHRIDQKLEAHFEEIHGFEPAVIADRFRRLSLELLDRDRYHTSGS